eukprot:CAMPEP_0204352380 /NCGR_PEP_ID=MMETSP0469-20131031/31849_1 /ASSEMBLY_ACC=CAM_ASM_000384 /TAXON_ID=2969 /ORGANISM="Oxyrrhis marina" /LENGTH=83 /DNA_ID=CAMNT_0051339103 /DNA_START=225 /DNA_END=476 /DNA_ORIENTATION=-
MATPMTSVTAPKYMTALPSWPCHGYRFSPLVVSSWIFTKPTTSTTSVNRSVKYPTYTWIFRMGEDAAAKWDAPARWCATKMAE